MGRDEEGDTLMGYYNAETIYTSTAQPALQNIICPHCRREFYNQLPGWKFNDYTIPCPYCKRNIGINDD